MALIRRDPVFAPALAFAGLGLFWGAWDACLPELSAGLDVSDGRLGLLLTCTILGAIPAMRLSGRLANRGGARLLPAAVAGFALAAALPALARGPVWLGAALIGTGAASGALDVVMNTAASQAEILGGQHRMSLVHASYSAALAAGAAGAGLLLAWTGFRLVLLVAAAVILALAPLTRSRAAALPPAGGQPGRAAGAASLPVVALGVVCAIGFTMENGIEMWSALLLRREMAAPAAIAALGPALFGVAAAGGRLAGHGLVRALGEVRLLLLCGVIAATGTLCLAMAPSWQWALPAMLLCGGGVSVVAPTVVSLAGRAVAPERRGSAVSTVAQIAYAGLLLAPVLMGGLSGWLGLRAAVLVFAGFALAFGGGGAGLVLVLRARFGLVRLV